VLPIVESRIPVDSVDRVVVRQARDIESTYYLLKQFLADEQLRSTILVPFGVALLLVPALFYWFSAGEAIAGVAGLLGAARSCIKASRSTGSSRGCPNGSARRCTPVRCRW